MASPVGKMVTHTITPPIFVIEGRDISIYTAAENALNDLEAIDIKNGAYVVYDSEGRLLQLGADKKRVPIFGGLLKTDVEQVVLKEIKESPAHKEELRSSLIDLLRAKNISEELLQKVSFGELVQMAIEKYGLTA